jgi:hypothetical protein
MDHPPRLPSEPKAAADDTPLLPVVAITDDDGGLGTGTVVNAAPPLPLDPTAKASNAEKRSAGAVAERMDVVDTDTLGVVEALLPVELPSEKFPNRLDSDGIVVVVVATDGGETTWNGSV